VSLSRVPEHQHRRTRRATDSELGYSRVVCAECGVTWPCQEFVKETCERTHLAHGLGCDCGWHDDEKVAQDPEQEKPLTQSKRYDGTAA
jgi:ribosomal protein L32